jgi:hypothetical protein
MRLDQPGYQRTPAAFDDRRASGSIEALADFLDQIALDEDVLPQSKFVARAIENIDVFDQRLCRSFALCKRGAPHAESQKANRYEAQRQISKFHGMTPLLKAIARTIAWPVSAARRRIARV